MGIIAIFIVLRVRVVKESSMNESLLDGVKESSMSESLFDWARR